MWLLPFPLQQQQHRALRWYLLYLCLQQMISQGHLSVVVGGPSRPLRWHAALLSPEAHAMVIFGLCPRTIQKYQHHKITAWLRLEGTSEGHLVSTPALARPPRAS